MADKLFLTLHKLGMVHPFVRFSSRLRLEILKGCKYNTDLVTNRLIHVDMVTDSLMHSVLERMSLTGKGSAEVSFINLSDTFRRCFGYRHVFPVAQGRMAELVFVNAHKLSSAVVPNNMLFPTTRSHQELAGATTSEIPVPEAYDPQNDFPFKGNMDTEKLEKLISEHGPENIPYVYVEACVNASGGHPVSISNLRAVHDISRRNGIPVIIDACRILENAWLIRERQEGYVSKSIGEIVLEFCSHSDGCTMSATKDYCVDTGGFIATNDDDMRCRIQDMMMLTGDGLSVRAKAALNKALIHGFRHDTLVKARVTKAEYLWKLLKECGVPVVQPPGGHAVYIDARELYQHMPEEKFPEKAFLVQLYLDSGVMGSENMITPSQQERRTHMIRLALPIHGYSFSRLRYVAKSVGRLWNGLDKLKGLRKVHELPCRSGAFLAEYERE